MNRFILGLAAVALMALAQAPRGVDDPRAFVQQRYAQYRNGTQPSLHLDANASERLTALAYAADEADGGEDRLGFDWWVNGQDWRLSNVRGTQIEAGPDRRVVIARFANFGREGTHRFHFVRERGRWYLDEVTNVTGPERWRLSALLRRTAE